MKKQIYPIARYSGSGKGRSGSLAVNEMKIELDGMKVVLEKKVALIPVNIIEQK